MKTMEELVSRFLSWNLPGDVSVDPCAMALDYPHRTGTNLLTADQARQMLEHVFGENDREAALLFAALKVCVDAMLRMIPDYCEENAAEPCTDLEHDQALAAAGRPLYGHNSVDWPAGLRKAAGGKYA